MDYICIYVCVYVDVCSHMFTPLAHTYLKPNPHDPKTDGEAGGREGPAARLPPHRLPGLDTPVDIVVSFLGMHFSNQS